MIKMGRCFVGVLALASVTACSGNLPPNPFPTPPAPAPTPAPNPPPSIPEPACLPGQTHSCWHQPPDSSVPLYACPVYDAGSAVIGIINVVEGPSHCPAMPSAPLVTCDPVLDPVLSAPANDDSNWAKAGDQTTSNWFKQAVWQAVSAAKAACPKVWRGDCLVAGEPGIDKGYLLIAKELQRVGYAASQAQDSEGRKYDHLWVRGVASMKDWNATKLFNYGNGCLITGDGAFTAHGWYTFVGNDPTPPTPEQPPATPPTAGACPIAPCPDLVWTEATLPDGWSREEIGRPRLQFNSSTYVGRWKDNTLVVKRNEPYCASIGMSPMADGQPRAACPLRPDGHADREALEAWASGGFKLESQNGTTCVAHPSNPVMFEPSGGNCRLCTVRTFKEGKPLCGEWF